MNTSLYFNTSEQCRLSGSGLGIGSSVISNQWAITQSNIMTQPLEHKTFLFGSDITTMSNETIVCQIKKAGDEINSYANIPDNKYTKRRVANLQDAIEAAVKELNKRVEAA